MKPRLQTSLGQQLVLTPQLRQAIHLLQLSALELEAELAEAVETNPLLDWAEPEPLRAPVADDAPREDGDGDGAPSDDQPPWTRSDEPWQQRVGPTSEDEDDGDAADRVAEPTTLRDHLQWQLHLSHLSPRDRRIGAALIDAIDDDGYLREPLDALRDSLRPELVVQVEELVAVLRVLQGFDPAGVGARDLGECLALQLTPLPEDTPGKALALRIAAGPIDRLPKVGIEGIAAELQADACDAAIALQLLRSLDPRPGAQIGSMPNDTYITPDCVIWRQQGVWRVGLASGRTPRLTIHRGYEQMIGRAGASDGYLRGRLQEARWLLRNIEARGETLLKVVRCLVRQQSGFLEFGAQALRPLTLREVAAEVGLHESTVSRAIARKYVRTPRGTVALRSFFASGIDTGAGGETSSIAIQTMIRRLVDAENPRKPLSDARLADALKSAGVPVARRTVAKYREAMGIASSQERVRIA
ncbi:MAG TPA: RNA polymerase factor sigma-54 [Luteimonas sp.]|jgi:RNA polymerase sigma-54 factor|nr:RNA polymerase factor sigma-54 [Luteimonas sp.]